MAMQIGTTGQKGVAPQMNVTPLVDVVLVLLIIFMVITPLLSKQFWVHTPKQEKTEVTPEDVAKDPTPPLVLRVAFSIAAGVVCGLVLHYALYRIGLPLKPFIYVGF